MGASWIVLLFDHNVLLFALSHYHIIIYCYVIGLIMSHVNRRHVSWSFVRTLVKRIIIICDTKLRNKLLTVSGVLSIILHNYVMVAVYNECPDKTEPNEPDNIVQLLEEILVDVLDETDNNVYAGEYCGVVIVSCHLSRLFRWFSNSRLCWW